MPIFTGFNQNIPATGQAPAANYQQMQTNNVASYNIMSVDHYTYDGAYPGEHVQCTFPQFTSPTPSTPVSQGSVLYTVDGTLDPTSASLIFQNKNSLCSASGLRAFINVTTQSTPVGPYPKNVNLNPLNYFGFDGPNCVQRFLNPPTSSQIILPFLRYRVILSQFTDPAKLNLSTLDLTNILKPHILSIAPCTIFKKLPCCH